jgi:8-oxo-dGTP pyrophosphatase MutT (NUDIX family)
MSEVPVVEARPAATLILVRDGPAQPEILLLKRNAQARFMPNAHVFPGGAVDPEDGSPSAYASCVPMTDVQASRRLNVDSNGLQFFVAGIREAFEECGLLLAYESSGQVVALENMADDQLHTLRMQLISGDLDLATLCRTHGWRLAADSIGYISHWITPTSKSRRFDTRFFVGRAPAQQRASFAGTEMSQLLWRTATDALAEHNAGEILLMRATHTLLTEIAAFDDVDALLAHARSERDILPIAPVQ